MRGLRRRRIAWADVAAIERRSSLGWRGVQVWTVSGRRRRLRAPASQFNVGREKFEADVTLLEQWWWSHTSEAA